MFILKSLRQLFKPTTSLNEAVEGRVLWILILVALIQFGYPISENPHIIPQLIYQSIYTLLILAGILVARDNLTHMRILIGVGVAWAITGTIYAFNRENFLAIIAAYATLIIFLGSIVRILLEYIFRAKVINQDVIYAACAVYLLLGALFVPIYGTLEAITYEFTGEHAFSESGTEQDEFFRWQHLVYFSYVTLTTAGYGDILPLTMWARSLANLQAVIGVLYITIVMARLVGLYTSRELEGEIQALEAREEAREEARQSETSTL
jgi:hypothetical protein